MKKLYCFTLSFVILTTLIGCSSNKDIVAYPQDNYNYFDISPEDVETFIKKVLPDNIDENFKIENDGPMLSDETTVVWEAKLNDDVGISLFTNNENKIKKIVFDMWNVTVDDSSNKIVEQLQASLFKLTAEEDTQAVTDNLMKYYQKDETTKAHEGVAVSKHILYSWEHTELKNGSCTYFFRISPTAFANQEEYEKDLNSKFTKIDERIKNLETTLDRKEVSSIKDEIIEYKNYNDKYDGWITSLNTITTTIDEKEKADKEAEEQRKAEEIAAKSRTFSAGTYSVGSDIPTGVYDIVAISGNGNLFIKGDRSNFVNEIMGITDPSFYLETYSNARLTSTQSIQIKGTLVLEFQAKE